MKPLNLKTTQINNNYPVKVLQFGGGNFLRAFSNWIVEILNEQTDFGGNVIIVKPTGGSSYHQLIDQDGLYHVVPNGKIKNKPVSNLKLITNVRQIVHPYQDWNSYLATAEIATIQFIISNTTEAGIQFNSSDLIDNLPPNEFPAKLTHWLYHRFIHFEGDFSKGCIFLPCELIENNGEALKSCILKYADLWHLEENFKDWICNHNYFHNTLVDRIVSGFPVSRAKELNASTGFEDQLMVACESYHSWVIEGNEIIKNMFPVDQTDLNIQFVNDLKPYREMKVRILNGAHTAMVPIGYLCGLKMVSEVMENDHTSKFIENLLFDEVAATIDLPSLETKDFAEDVLDRFRNPYLKHMLISIALNSTSKFITRLLPTLKDYIQKKGSLPVHIVFSIAALIRFYKGRFDNNKIPLQDAPEAIKFFEQCWQRYEAGETDIKKMTADILSNQNIWHEDLCEIQGLTELTAKYLGQIEMLGLKKAIKDFNTNRTIF